MWGADKTLKYAGALACGLLAIGTLPSAYLIAYGLLKGAVNPDEVNHFSGKLIVYLGWLVLLGYGSYRLWRAGAKRSRWARR